MTKTQEFIFFCDSMMTIVCLMRQDWQVSFHEDHRGFYLELYKHGRRSLVFYDMDSLRGLEDLLQGGL